MKLRLKTTFLIVIIIIISFKSLIFASTIELNGEFDDWDNKPFLTDPEGDESLVKDIVMIKWYPDGEDNRLYLFAERKGVDDHKNKDKDKDNGNGKKDEEEDDRYDEDYDESSVSDDDIYEDVQRNFLNILGSRFKYWFFTIEFSSGAGDRKAYVFYHPPSRKVFVMLFDVRGRYLWSGNGKWGDKKNEAKRVEFYVPLTYLNGEIPGGYEIDLSFKSGDDRVPDSGTVKVSTISTYPLLTFVFIFTLVFAGIFYKVKRKDNKLC